jgi:hypothetical protein
MIGEAVRAAPNVAAPDLWPVFAMLRRFRRWRSGGRSRTFFRFDVDRMDARSPTCSDSRCRARPSALLDEPRVHRLRSMRFLSRLPCDGLPSAVLPDPASPSCWRKS